jgi:hypothetical protein
MAKGMTEAHKKALARGRKQSKAVRDYLEALEQEKKPGRRVSEDSLQDQIKKAQKQIDAEPNAAKRVELIQKRLDAEMKLAELEERPNLESLEKEFAKVAKDYSERKDITYTAWREAGVPARVLRDAGIPRTRRPSG